MVPVTAKLIPLSTDRSKQKRSSGQWQGKKMRPRVIYRFRSQAFIAYTDSSDEVVKAAVERSDRRTHKRIDRISQVWEDIRIGSMKTEA
jgi:hypothetical protein